MKGMNYLSYIHLEQHWQERLCFGRIVLITILEYHKQKKVVSLVKRVQAIESKTFERAVYKSPECFRQGYLFYEHINKLSHRANRLVLYGDFIALRIGL